MKNHKIKFPKGMYQRLRDHLLQNANEQLAYLFCHQSTDAYGNVCILPGKLIAIDSCPDDDTLKRTGTSICVEPELVNEVYAQFIESEYSCLVNCHSHPFSSSKVSFSGVDDREDKLEAQYVYGELNSVRNEHCRKAEHSFASIVVSQSDFDSRLVTKDGKFETVETITSLDNGMTIEKHRSHNSASEIGKAWHRQTLAFGEEFQQSISRSSVAVLGCGGLGSIIAEGIVRLGCKKIVLIDDDNLESSNLNRWQGAKLSDVSRPKVEVLKELLLAYNPVIDVEVVSASVHSEEAISRFKNCDFYLGCFDNHKARFLINRVAVQYRAIYLDAASVIEMDSSGQIDLLGNRLGVVLPGVSACMDCSQIDYYDRESILRGYADPGLQEGMRKQGYLDSNNDMEEEGPSPSVYPLNMMVSSLLLMEFANLFGKFRPLAVNQYLNSVNLNTPNMISAELDLIEDYPGKDCPNCSSVLGAGDSISLENFYEREEKAIVLDNLDLSEAIAI